MKNFHKISNISYLPYLVINALDRLIWCEFEWIRIRSNYLTKMWSTCFQVGRFLQELLSTHRYYSNCNFTVVIFSSFSPPPLTVFLLGSFLMRQYFVDLWLKLITTIKDEGSSKLDDKCPLQKVLWKKDSTETKFTRNKIHTFLHFYRKEGRIEGKIVHWNGILVQ